jgi:hypothetical protein
MVDMVESIRLVQAMPTKLTELPPSFQRAGAQRVHFKADYREQSSEGASISTASAQMVTQPRIAQGITVA